MNQNYRKNDPPTSALAGQDMEASSSAKHQRAMCFNAVIATPGLTAREIEDQVGIKAHKRLPELRADGVVRNGPSRTCTVSEHQAMTWYPQTPNTSGTLKNGECACH